jgi:serine protease
MQFRFALQNSLLFLLAMYSMASWSAERWVIQFKENLPAVESSKADLRLRLAELSKVHKRTFQLVRQFGEHGAVVSIPNDDNTEQMRLHLLSDPRIESAEPDRRIRLHARSPLIGVLNSLDPSLRSRSWFHQDLNSQPASINTGAMWANFHGTAPTVVAVLDTGVLPSHPMLQGHLLSGYDFVSDALIGADAQNSPDSDRDSDPTDPGDGVGPDDLLSDPFCTGLSQSSWHGTFVSALLAGNPVPNEGIFSVNWNAVVLPVRVLGKCGGFSSDLADAIRWAAGLSVSGVPDNPFPAKVINLSLGAEGACVASIEGAAIGAARQAGSLVVVAAGNNGGTVDSPANCPGAFGVAAMDQQGLKANYSNFGSNIQLSAPGGDAAFPIWSAGNTGFGGSLSNTYTTKIGTSFSSPMVAGAASLYWSLNPSSSVSAIENLLKTTARPFLSLGGRPVCTADSLGVECNCTRSFCGAGMLVVANLINSQAAGGLTNLFSNRGNVIPPSQTRTFSADGTFNSLGQTLNAVSFDVLNILKSTVDAPNPVLSSSGLNVEITASEGILGFDLRAQAVNGRTTIVSILVSDQEVTSPTLLASLLSPLVNGAFSGLRAPSSPVGDAVVDNSGNSPVTGGSGNSGGGGTLSLLGLFLTFFLVYRFKKKNSALKFPVVGL